MHSSQPVSGIEDEMEKDLEIRKQTKLAGELTVPGDKSISHRAVMFGSLAKGSTRVSHFLTGADCLSTISCFRKMGIGIDLCKDEVIIEGKGLHGLKAPSECLDVGNSGTTTRLMAGILAGQEFESLVDGDESMRRRPMKRILEPLSRMGARAESLSGDGTLPLQIQGTRLHGIHYDSPVASAQVKSCVLLAGLYADSRTTVTEPVLSRDHTERMLRFFGAEVCQDGKTASIEPEPDLKGRSIAVPGDISSAAYFIAAGLITPHSEILLKNVGINPTRDGMLRVLKNMGADITLLNQKEGAEPTADLLVRYSVLHGTTIQGEIIPALIDELPVLAVLAAFAEGKTVIRDAKELRVKESDRIEVMAGGLAKMGCEVETAPDGMTIYGGRPLHGALIDPAKDHRAAMSFAVAGTVCDGPLLIRDADCVKISYPGFYGDLYSLGGTITV